MPSKHEVAGSTPAGRAILDEHSSTQVWRVGPYDSSLAQALAVTDSCAELTGTADCLGGVLQKVAFAVAAIRRTNSLVEPLALLSYAITAVSLTATGLLAELLGFTIAPDCWPIFWAWPLLVFGAALLRRVGHRRSAAALEGVTLIYGQVGVHAPVVPIIGDKRPIRRSWAGGPRQCARLQLGNICPASIARRAIASLRV